MKNKFTWLKSFISFILLGAVVLGVPTHTMAGNMHASAIIGLGISSRTASHHGVAHAERRQGSKYRVAHEELGYNYTYGNAGSGHCHHHAGSPRPSGDESQEGDIREIPVRDLPVPILGSRGTSQSITQYWLPYGENIEISWTRDSFLQIDPSEIPLLLGGQIVSRGSITLSSGLHGTVELSVRLNRFRQPQVETRLTGVFKRARFELVTHPNGVISLQFRQPLKWIVRSTVENFDISLDASIEESFTRGLIFRSPSL